MALKKDSHDFLSSCQMYEESFELENAEQKLKRKDPLKQAFLHTLLVLGDLQLPEHPAIQILRNHLAHH